MLASAVYAVSALQSLCLRRLRSSQVSSTKMSKREVTQTTPHNIPGILVLDAKDHVEIRLKVILIRTQNAGCVGENLRFSIYSRTPPFSTLFCVSFPVCVTGGDRHQMRSGSRGLFKFK